MSAPTATLPPLPGMTSRRHLQWMHQETYKKNIEYTSCRRSQGGGAPFPPGIKADLKSWADTSPRNSVILVATTMIFFAINVRVYQDWHVSGLIRICGSDHLAFLFAKKMPVTRMPVTSSCKKFSLIVPVRKALYGSEIWYSVYRSHIEAVKNVFNHRNLDFQTGPTGLI